MRLSKIRFKLKKRTGKNKSLNSNTEDVPLIELHPYSRSPEAQPVEEEYHWHAPRPLDLNTPTRSVRAKSKHKESRRTKIINIIFPARLGDLATALRLQIETVNGTCVPITGADILLPRPIYAAGRGRQRMGGNGRAKIGASGSGERGSENVRLCGDAGVNINPKREETIKEKGKGKVRFLFDGDVVREVVDVKLENGEGSSKGSVSGSVGTVSKGKNSSVISGGSSVVLGWADAAEFGVFL